MAEPSSIFIAEEGKTWYRKQIMPDDLEYVPAHWKTLAEASETELGRLAETVRKFVRFHEQGMQNADLEGYWAAYREMTAAVGLP